MHREEPKAPQHMTKFARHLRKEAPVPERILWGLVRHRQLGGFKFRRQQPLGPYLADFFCEEANLVVELDGESHTDRSTHDEARTTKHAIGTSSAAAWQSCALATTSY